ncbi:MAG: DPP IV N-terminal domain-containing protein [Rikenellaceae bacterium]|nr:DPP IV N-terminal domain-containing protein [Rikenellaceae bacterium]
MKKLLLLVGATLAVGYLSAAPRPEKKSPNAPFNRYELAERFSGGKLGAMLFSTSVDPHWFKSGEKFWYSYKTGQGTKWYIVDPAKRSRKELFDHDKLAAQLTEIVKDPYIASQLPIRNLEVDEDGYTFTFEVTSSQDAKEKPLTKEDSLAGKKPKKAEGKEIFYFSYDSRNGELTHLKDKEKETRQLWWASVSPDGKTVVYAKDMNLYRMSREDYEKLKKDDKDSTVVETQITTDGIEDFGFGQPYSMLNTDTLCNGKRRGAYGVWSPDSRYFATIVTDQRQVKELWVINALAHPRPTLETYKYQMPGEKEAPQYHLYLFDMQDNSRKEIMTGRFKDQTLSIATCPREHKQRHMYDQPNVWLGDNNRFFVTRSSRDLHRIDICSYTIGSDTLRPIIEERMNTYIEVRPLSAVGQGKQLIQWSERDGWAHLYLYSDDGTLIRRLTEGPWHVHQILKVDEKARKVYFTAMGREKGENPYYQHLYSVSLDGGEVRLLGKDNAFHSPQVDDACKFFVDNYSRVDTIPQTALYSTDGRKIMTLEVSDFSQLLAADYRFPETFTVKAADGVTDLYGVMYKPFDFDSTRHYPIIDYVYPGPQVEATQYPFTRMSVRTDRLAQAGFIVITVGNRGGHPNRSKWYHNYGYGNLRDYGLADQKAAIEQLAARHNYIDINRVGIHGHSGGGFMSTAAILQYPDFFKVAVSCAGNHDNRIYNRWWSETHHGVKEKIDDQGDTTFVYRISTNPELAHRLKGHLMLVHGEIDNNVHPGNTSRVAEALIRAGKRFDMLYLPTQRHSFGWMDEYFYWRMVDYFTDHLLLNRPTPPVDIPKR